MDHQGGFWYFGLRRVDDKSLPSVIVQYDINKKVEVARFEVQPEPIFYSLLWHPVRKLLYCFRQSVYGAETSLGTFDMKTGYTKQNEIRSLQHVWRSYLDTESNSVFAFVTGRGDIFKYYARINLDTGMDRQLSNGNYPSWNLTCATPLIFLQPKSMLILIAWNLDTGDSGTQRRGLISLCRITERLRTPTPSQINGFQHTRRKP